MNFNTGSIFNLSNDIFITLCNEYIPTKEVVTFSSTCNVFRKFITMNDFIRIKSGENESERRDSKLVKNTGYYCSYKYRNNLMNINLIKMCDSWSLNLIDLNFTNCFKLTDDAFDYVIKVCKNIKTIDASLNNNLTDNAFKKLNLLPNLKAINLRDTNVTDTICLILAYSNSLESIMFKRCQGINYCITDTGVKALATCPNLRLISIEYYSLTDISIKYLTNCTLLNFVDFSGSHKMTNLATSYLSQCKNIQIVVLNNCCRMTNDAVKTLNSNPTIKELYFLNCGNISYEAYDTCKKLRYDFSDDLRLRAISI